MKTIYRYVDPAPRRAAKLIISVDEENGVIDFEVDGCCGPHGVGVPRHEYLALSKAVGDALLMIAVKRNPFGDPPPFDGSRVNPALGPDGPPPPDHVEVDTP